MFTVSAAKHGGADLWFWSQTVARFGPTCCASQEVADSGLTAGLVRVSVGAEEWRDLLADFEQAPVLLG